MPFTESEIAEHTEPIEDLFWSRRRRPLHLRDKIREGQRFAGQAIELFFVRPAFERPGQFIEEPIAKVTYVRSQKVWRIYWQRADLKWHGYEPHPSARTLGEALKVIDGMSAIVSSCERIGRDSRESQRIGPDGAGPSIRELPLLPPGDRARSRLNPVEWPTQPC